MALKTMVIEQEQPSDAVIPDQDRHEFKRSQKIPDGFRIWVFTHETQDWYASFWHQTLMASLDPRSPPGTGKLKNIQTTTIGVGRLLMFACISRLPGFHLDLHELRHFGRRIWPFRPDAVPWPLPVLDGGTIDRLALHINELMASPIAVWRPFPAD